MKNVKPLPESAKKNVRISQRSMGFQHKDNGVLVTKFGQGVEFLSTEGGVATKQAPGIPKAHREREAERERGEGGN